MEGKVRLILYNSRLLTYVSMTINFNWTLTYCDIIRFTHFYFVESYTTALFN